MQRFFVAILFIFIATASSGQSGFSTFISRADSQNITNAREKIFIHYDRPHYNLGDTMWARGYIAAAYNHSLNDSSRLVYVEIIDGKGKTVNRISANCLLGQFDCSIPLKDGIFSEGTYLLRAYTQWMRNFGDSLFYESYFKILDFKSIKWQTTIKKINLTGDKLQMSAQVKPLNSQFLNHQVLAIVRSKRKKILSLSGYTDGDGNFAIDTLVPKATNRKDLSIELINDGRSLITMPLTVTSLQPADLQFLPEGGSFVAGFNQRLGFKAIDSYGKGMDVKGVIKNSKGETITAFATTHNGMGVVSFMPQSGEQYTASLENGLQFALPVTTFSGIVLSVTEKTDSLLVNVQATNEYNNQPLYLAASVRGWAYARGKISLKNGSYNLMLAKSSFPSGVVRFTIYNGQLLPLNERAAFVWHKDDMKLEMNTHKPVYTTRDSVHLSVKIKDYNPNDSISFFSMAVIDSSQLAYSPYRENILSYMLLTSDLKGEVEEPYYYLTNPAPGAIDALMLTQGWVKYNWQTDSSFQYKHEKEFTVSGKVINFRNKGMEGFNLILKGKSEDKDYFIKHCVTDNNGRFIFSSFPLMNDSSNIGIKAFEKRKELLLQNIKEIKIDRLPDYTMSEEMRYVKDYLNLDTAVRKYYNKQLKIKRGKEYLEEVVVKTRGTIPGSRLYGSNEFADVEEDETFGIFYVRNIRPLTEIRIERNSGLISGCNIFFVDRILGGFEGFYTRDSPEAKIISSANIKSYLFSYSMKNDIKSIEVSKPMLIPKPYLDSYEWLRELNSTKVRFTVCIINIKTYSGEGPYLYRPGLLDNDEKFFRPLLPTVAKEFYQPKYTAALKDDELPNLPATVYWKNYLMPDSSGVLQADFYTSDSDKNYLIILQGMSQDGKLGFLQQALNLENKK